MTEESWLKSQQGQQIFLFSKTSSLAVGSTKPPIQQVLRNFYLEVKQPEHDADHFPPSGAKVKNVYGSTSTPPYAFMAHKGTTLPIVNFKSVCMRPCIYHFGIKDCDKMCLKSLSTTHKIPPLNPVLRKFNPLTFLFQHYPPIQFCNLNFLYVPSSSYVCNITCPTHS